MILIIKHDVIFYTKHVIFIRLNFFKILLFVKIFYNNIICNFITYFFGWKYYISVIFKIILLIYNFFDKHSNLSNFITSYNEVLIPKSEIINRSLIQFIVLSHLSLLYKLLQFSTFQTIHKFILESVPSVMPSLKKKV